MRLSILPLLLTGATVVGLVASEPLRVIENPSNANANIRFGHALANANVNGNDDNVARVVRPVVLMKSAPQENDKGFSRHLCGASLREKALRLSNAFRHALGMPPIEVDVAAPGPAGVHILPMPYSLNNVMVHSLDEDGKHRKHHDDEHPGHLADSEDHEHHRPHHEYRHGRHGRLHHKHHKSFLRRIQKAIRALGPWEGRAVAFVLGCGIGVLLRMFWVLSVLAYRTVRGERGEETFDREYIVYERVPETVFVAPPQYVDEKVKVDAHEVEERK